MRRLALIITTIFLVVSCAVSRKSDTKPLDIQLIRNATLKLQYNGKTLLVDPSLSPKNSFMSFVVPNQNLNPTKDLPLSIKEITNGVEAILVTHTHLDHFDETAKSSLNASLPLFGQPSDKDILEKSTFTNVTLVSEKEEYEGISITRTNGKHGPDHLLEGLGSVSGFVLQAKGYPTLYIVGDCLLDNEIKQTIIKYNPDIIIVNSGGAKWGGEQILMDEKDVIDVVNFAPNAKVMAVHMDALDHCQTTREILRNKAKKENVNIIIPEDGEIVTF